MLMLPPLTIPGTIPPQQFVTMGQRYPRVITVGPHLLSNSQYWHSTDLHCEGMLLVARGLRRDTENNRDDWEILLEFLSAI